MFSAIGSAFFLGLAWWYPGTSLSALLTWPAAFCLILTARSNRPLRNLYIAGLLTQPAGFFWLYGTINHFGNFGVIPSVIIFGIFTVLSAIQFAFFAVLYKYLPKHLDFLALRAPFAWCVAEFLSIRIFPWHLGHTQIAFTDLVQISDIYGSIGVSFLIMWVAESILLIRRKHLTAILTSFIVLVLSLLYGLKQRIYFAPEMLGEDSLLRDKQLVALAQGNVSLEEKHDAEMVAENLLRYKALSTPYDTPETLIIWPETVMLSWVHTNTVHVQQDPRLPFFSDASLLMGSLMFQDRDHTYNSVISIRGDGSLGTPYHKQALMPFGEYTPFGDVIPFLRDLNATAGDFTKGVGPQIQRIAFHGSERTIDVGSLICYEDVVQDLAAAAAHSGAEILVNQTNDAWFGDTVAPRQHHLIASFRAIENKRYHLRDTNTGLTAIVDPLGRTTAELPTYAEAVLTGEVYTIHHLTWFSRYPNLIWQILALIVVPTVALNMVLRH